MTQYIGNHNGITTGPAPVVLSLDDMDAIMSLLDGTRQGVDPIQLEAEIVVDVDYADHDDTPIYTAEHLQVRMDERPSWVARDDADWIKLVEGMNGLLKKLATSRQHGSAHRAVLQRRLESDIKLAREIAEEARAADYFDTLPACKSLRAASGLMALSAGGVA